MGFSAKIFESRIASTEKTTTIADIYFALRSHCQPQQKTAIFHFAAIFSDHKNCCRQTIFAMTLCLFFMMLMNDGKKCSVSWSKCKCQKGSGHNARIFFIRRHLIQVVLHFFTIKVNAGNMLGWEDSCFGWPKKLGHFLRKFEFDNKGGFSFVRPFIHPSSIGIPQFSANKKQSAIVK